MNFAPLSHADVRAVGHEISEQSQTLPANLRVQLEMGRR